MRLPEPQIGSLVCGLWGHQTSDPEANPAAAARRAKQGSSGPSQRVHYKKRDGVRLGWGEKKGKDAKILFFWKEGRAA